MSLEILADVFKTGQFDGFGKVCDNFFNGPALREGVVVRVEDCVGFEELDYAAGGEVFKHAFGVGGPVADALREVGGVDEVEGGLPEPRLFDVVDFEGAVGRDPGVC